MLDWFKFESKKNLNIRKRKYYKKIYPYGDKQKLWEEELLINKFGKNNIELNNYALILLKDEIEKIKQDIDDDIRYKNLYEDENRIDDIINKQINKNLDEIIIKAINIWLATTSVRNICKEVQDFIISLVEFEYKINSFEELKSFKGVRYE